jgi:hypothetical protein
VKVITLSSIFFDIICDGRLGFCSHTDKYQHYDTTEQGNVNNHVETDVYLFILFI